MYAAYFVRTVFTPVSKQHRVCDYKRKARDQIDTIRITVLGHLNETKSFQTKSRTPLKKLFRP